MSLLGLTRLLSRAPHYKAVAARRTASGFTSFQFLAAVVFIVSFAIFMALQYRAANSDTAAGVSEPAAMPTADASANTSDVRQVDTRPAGDEKESSQGSGIKLMLAGFFNDDDESPYADEALMPAYTAAEHAEWVDEFFVRLNSPEAPAAYAEETAPVISGRVLTRHGWPVAGIEVTAQLRDYFKNADSSARALSTPQTTTNDDGFYAFRNLPAGIYMIGTRDSGGYAAARIEVRTGVKYADLVLNALRDAQVRGVVTDPMGMALGDVRIMPLVKGIPAGAVSDANGEFRFAVALETETRGFQVRFQRDGYQEQRHQVTAADWAADGSMAVAVTMEPVYEFAMFSGSVTDTDGVQIAGETVRLYSPSLKRNYRAVADDGGEFEFSKVDVADDYQLWVRPTGPYRDYTEQNLELSPGSLRRRIELESLNRGHRLSGRILDQDEKPVPNFTLTLSSKAASGQKLPVTSDAHGNFQVKNVPEGELVFESRTMPYYTLSGLHLSGNDTEHEVKLIVNRGQHKLLGTVVDSDGRPVASPRVSITSSQMINGMQSRSSSSTAADAKGRFLFTDLGAGQHTVTVNAPGYEGVRLKPVVGTQNELVVRLEKNSI